MTRTALIVTAGLLAAIAATPSRSADLNPPRPYIEAPAHRPAYVAPFTWQGFYVDYNVGYGFGDSTLTGTTTGISTSVGPAGAILGSGLGYNFQSGNVVYGFEVDSDYSWMDDTAGAVAPCANCKARIYYLATLRGRVGYAFDRWLPYVTGGATFAGLHLSAPAVSGQGRNQIGWTAGGGIEYAFLYRWSAKLEYLYADLGAMTCDAAHCGTSTRADFTTNVVRVGLNYHF
jgi:outer membrane immunogenic protein